MSSSAVEATESIAPSEVYKVFRKVGLSVSPPLNPPPQPQTNSHVTFPFFPVEVLGMRAGDSSSNSACTRLFFFLLLTFQTLSALPSHHFPLLHELFSNIYFLALSQTVTNKPPLVDSVCVCELFINSCGTLMNESYSICLCDWQVKQIMEEAVTRKFVHEDSSHIVSFCGESPNANESHSLSSFITPLPLKQLMNAEKKLWVCREGRGGCFNQHFRVRVARLAPSCCSLAIVYVSVLYLFFIAFLWCNFSYFFAGIY